ncbi:hypothetical protein SRHO_G00143020 [Serrasalmus rhombeus]
MKPQLTLVLICVLFPKALTLVCYQCFPDLSGTCTDTQNCPDQCGSQTIVMSTGGVDKEVSGKTCSTAALCVSGSLNLGFSSLSLSSQCCSTDLCNSQKAPALSQGSSNGNKCYTCTGDDCTGTVSCLGDEAQCISATGTVAGAQVTVKGCVSRSLCTADIANLQAAGINGSVSCCEGNLCNSAEGVKLSLLIMLVPLISSILFI